MLFIGASIFCAGPARTFFRPSSLVSFSSLFFFSFSFLSLSATAFSNLVVSLTSLRRSSILSKISSKPCSTCSLDTSVLDGSLRSSSLISGLYFTIAPVLVPGSSALVGRRPPPRRQISFSKHFRQMF
jgi:hypothetical protein